MSNDKYWFLFLPVLITTKSKCQYEKSTFRFLCVTDCATGDILYAFSSNAPNDSSSNDDGDDEAVE